MDSAGLAADGLPGREGAHRGRHPVRRRSRARTFRRPTPEREGTTVDATHAIDDEQRGRLRARIGEERLRAETREATLERQLEDIIASTDTANVDDEHDPEGSTIAFERAQVIELLKVTRVEMRELDEAVERLDGPAFGVCERCGRPIPVERLLARPASRRCVTCAADR